MLDCRRVDSLRLRFPNREHADLRLSQGVHDIGHDAEGRPCLVDDSATAIVKFCVDRRGVWLQLREGASGLHVNGRSVRRMAMLRAGDAIYLDGFELVLLGAEPLPAPPAGSAPAQGDRRIVLRGVGGLHHGRCFNLEEPRVIGRAPDCGIRIEEAAFAAHHARFEPHADGVVLRLLAGRHNWMVNGESIGEALLLPGDQVVFESQHRFVVEAPMRPSAEQLVPTLSAESDSAEPEEVRSPLPSTVRRMPWLLLAALLLAGALSLLLMYGAR